MDLLLRIYGLKNKVVYLRESPAEKKRICLSPFDLCYSPKTFRRKFGRKKEELVRRGHLYLLTAIE